MEIITFEDWALLIVGTGAIAMVFGSLIGWVIFGNEK
jgi:hypothetical protein